jgi:hypothetical protein
MAPLWEIEYSDEVKFYFIDNGTYTGNLLGEIERLRDAQDGLPAENYAEIEPDHIEWAILGHLVFYWRREKKLVVTVVKPL